jgi:hypothetical protein
MGPVTANAIDSIEQKDRFGYENSSAPPSEALPDERLELSSLHALGKAANDGVPQATTQRARELRCLVCAAGHLLHELDAWPASRLVVIERTFDVRALREQSAEDDSVLERLRGALTHARRGGVRGVAEQHNSPAAPPRQAWKVVHVVPQDPVVVVGGGEHIADRRAPVLEPALQLGLSAGRLVGLAFRSVLRREPVRAPATDVDEPEPLTQPPGLSQPSGSSATVETPRQAVYPA